MGYAADQTPLWPYPPEWGNGLSEGLAFLTDVMQATNGAQQARALRDTPRRSFGMRCIIPGDARRATDAFRFYIGAKQLLLPIYPDVQSLDAALDAGVMAIPCRTAGFDFVAGGQCVLWGGVNTWEVVTIAAGGIAATALTLGAATVNAWGIGTRLYPLRKARLHGVPQAAHQSDDVVTVQAQFLIDEPCDWPGAWPTDATYRGVPVLEWRNEESDDPTDQYDRLSGAVDYNTGPVYYFDLPGMPFRAQPQRFLLADRTDHSAFRSMLYQLNGRAGQAWVPSWDADVQLRAAVTSTDSQLQITWCGYTQFGFQQANRRDLRIELYDGTVLYRRITGSADAGDHEVLQLDSAPGVAIALGAVRQINFMSLCALASDSVQLDHTTDADGVAVSTLNWQAVKSDV